METEKAIEVFKSFVELGNKTNADKINMTLDLANVILKYIETIEKDLEQEKEKNKELEENLKIATAMLTKGTYPEQKDGDNDFNKQFIAVDKIKEKRDELICKERTSKIEMGNLYRYGIAVLNSVLEGN